MKLTPVTSSNINAIGYNKDANELFVEFKSGKTFVCSDVSLDEHAALVASKSFGKHFNQFIKKVKVGREVWPLDSDKDGELWIKQIDR